MPLVAGVTHMAVTRLRTHRDVEKQATLEAVRDMLGSVAGVEDVVAFVERRLAADRGWKFIMVEPRLYADVIAHLPRHSRRPMVAMELFTRLFSYLPPDGNEVMADRRELARVVGCHPKRRFSEFAGEASRNQEETGGLGQGLDDEAEPVVAQRQALVLQQPGVAALDRPAPPAQP